MTDKNRHGLSRYISAKIKREVRQHDGFGCVLCGNAVYTYEHIDPVFEEATKHEADKIALLCAGCHDRVTRGLLSKEAVKTAKENPRCLREGFSFGPFDIGAKHPVIKIGPLTIRDTPMIVSIFGDPVLEIDPPEFEGGPFQLSALLSNNKGDEILRIDKNEWKTPISNWDVELKGSRITVRNALGDVALILRTDPPHSIILEQLNMYHKGATIKASEVLGSIEIIDPTGAKIVTPVATLGGCETAIQVSEDGIGFGLRCKVCRMS